MENPFLMRVFDCFAESLEELQSLRKVKLFFITVTRDRLTVTKLHDEVGTSPFGGTAVENLRNARMLHQSQGLTFRFESTDDIARFIAKADNL